MAAHECPVFAFQPPNAEGVRADAAVADFAFGKFFFLLAAQAGGVLAHLHLAQRFLAEAGEGGVGVQVFQQQMFVKTREGGFGQGDDFELLRFVQPVVFEDGAEEGERVEVGVTLVVGDGFAVARQGEGVEAGVEFHVFQTAFRGCQLRFQKRHPRVIEAGTASAGGEAV